MNRSGTRMMLGAGLCLLLATTAEAGWPRRQRVRTVPAPARATTYVPTGQTLAQATGTAPTPMLGSFYGTPYMTVRGNFPAGGGYTPLGQYGDNNLSLYGPLSALRATTAPVRVYARGYDGRPVLTDGTAFSTPNLPEISPVVYPSHANSAYYGFRRSNSPAQWENAINWLDQN